MGIQLSSCEVAFLLSDWLRDFGCRFGQGADCVLFQVLRCFSWSRFGVFPGFGGPARGSPTFLGEREQESESVSECKERENRSGIRKSLKGCSFGVKSKVFEIEVEEKKGKLQAIIVKRKRGISFWVRLGPASLGFFLESLIQCIKEVKAGRWERGWKENERSYSLKSYSIFIPKGKGEREGWFTMAEMLRSLGVVIGMRKRKQDETLSLKPSLEKTYAEVVKLPRNRGGDLVRVEVREKEISKNLRKLDHCLVGYWNPSSVRRERFRKIGDSNGKNLGLKGKVGLAKMEKGKVLLEFELMVEAKRALNYGKISSGRLLLRLESWSPKTGVLG
ncbi:hypothetical protein CK203_012346 [Vitis vinifera]|uniref:DUF4283 domain-containing protein n=1 Tax=Vitis vinifera TaxID=29760 RepID=A0A438JKW3_VITVI|nr:hypothetical protein CK203_012346 [Vitis vinifera]